MQKLMREMENWRQSMMKVAGFNNGREPEPLPTTLPPGAGFVPTPGLDFTESGQDIMYNPGFAAGPQIILPGVM